MRTTHTRALEIGLVAGALAGLSVNPLRKLLVQSPTMLAGGWDQALAAEHKLALGIFDALEATSSSQAARRALLLGQLKHALTKHALEEENAVYAALRAHGEAEAADHLNHEHGYVKQYLYELATMPKGDAGFLARLGEFRTMLARHMQEEENEVFPRLRARLSQVQNRALSTGMNKEGLQIA